jgi:hypothetical protein
MLPVVILGGRFGYARLTDRGESPVDAIRSLDSPVVVAPAEEPEASPEEPCPPALMPRVAHGSPPELLADDHERTSNLSRWTWAGSEYAGSLGVFLLEQRPPAQGL